MQHQIVSVYFPDKTLVSKIERSLINNASVSSFIVRAVEAYLKESTNETKIQEDDNE